MANPRILRWLHRIGYLTTALVALELLLIAGLTVTSWLKERASAATRIEDSRTRDGPVEYREPRVYRPDEIDLLNALPPLSSLSPNGFRFVAMSMGWSWYGYVFTIPDQGSVATGTLIIFDRKDHEKGTERLKRREIRFSLPRAIALNFANKFDRLTVGWPGESGWCLDGTSVVFERINAGHVTSGEGNSVCSPHYATLSRIALDLIEEQIPAADQPTDSSWLPPEFKTINSR